MKKFGFWYDENKSMDFMSQRQFLEVIGFKKNSI
jgi:hypothetical protein